MSISSTKDYSLFKPFFFNRKLKKRAYQNLLESMSRQSLMHLHPIVVTKDYEVLDGQHRLACAKELDQEVYFTMMPDVPLETLIGILIDLNFSLSRWGNYEFLDLYCKMQKPEYLKFKQFQDKFNLDLNIAVPLSKKRDKRQNINTKFRKGEFVFDDEKEINAIIGNAFQFLDEGIGALLIKARHPHQKTYFFDAYAKLMDLEGFSQAQMIYQLKTVGFSGLIAGTNMMSYYNQLSNLYRAKTPKEKKVA